MPAETESLLRLPKRQPAEGDDGERPKTSPGDRVAAEIARG
jgi:hypothetical protein